MPPVKVLVVDDSALMRRLIRRSLESHPDITVLDTAVDGNDALIKIKELEPDVVTLDVEMPVMDGLTALRRVMRECPRPVIMFSTLTAQGTKATIEALSAGALDFVTKPSSPARLGPMFEELAEKIRVVAAVPPSRFARRPMGRIRPPGGNIAFANPAGQRVNGAGKQAPIVVRRPAGRARLVVIGCSTGGPAALQQVVPALPSEFPAPVVIVQHIPEGFSRPLAEHLHRTSKLEVRHAQSGDLVKPGRVLVAPAGFEFSFRGGIGNTVVVLNRGRGPVPRGGFRPSVDAVMTAAAGLYGEGTVGVLMTGMGRDGMQGMLEIKRHNGRTIAEAESTCVIYGMPRAAIEAGAADRITPLTRIAREIIDIV